MKQVYLDNQSNTKMDDIVFNSMIPYMKQYYGNPQSIYSLGQISKDAIEKARVSVSKLINSKPEEIIFTSCGSESNNLAIKGYAYGNSKKGKHIIVSAIEHFSVLNAVKSLEKDGFEISKKQIVLDSPIKYAGNYKVDIKLFVGVVAKLMVEIKVL